MARVTLPKARQGLLRHCLKGDSVRYQSVFPNDVDGGAGGCATERVAGMGTAHLAMIGQIENGSSPSYRRHRQRRRHAFAEADHVSFHTIVLETEPFPRATEARLYLIEYQQDSVSVRPPTQGLRVV